jgi:fibronectin type III domain protein
MGRFGRITRATATLVLATIAVTAGLVPAARAAEADPSDVVLVLDYSASILTDANTRNKFGGALDAIATRVEQTSADLTSSDATVSMIQFATRAADYPGCVDLNLLDNPANVTKFAGCLHSLAAAYKKGLDPALTAKIGVDTNYVAAMQQAAKHLPADAVRPVMILFTDGRHDVKGVPASQVPVVRDELFGKRTPFALLPVGMGLAAQDRPALEAGLKNLQITKDMPACLTGTSLAWPNVVFDTPEKAGTAVATALQDATCTFTVAPTPAPTPLPDPGAPRGIRATAGDGHIDLAWAPPATPATPVVSYKSRCRPSSGGDNVDAPDSAATQLQSTVDGLTNGTEYTCEVAAVGAKNQGRWIPAASTATPIGKPAAPGAPGVEALNGALQVDVAASDPPGVSEYHVECSSDNGTSWPAVVDVPAASGHPVAEVRGLQNGTEYICRTYAQNAVGQSDASPASAAVKPCASFLDCNGLLLPVVGILGTILALGLLAVAIALFREGRRGYVLAVVDVVHTANLGGGNKLGLSFLRAPGSKVVTGIVADKGPNADIKIRLLPGGRFAVRDGAGRHVTSSGERLIAVVGGVRHEVVLHAFETNAASQVSRR